jgi:hypothetical protein
MEQEPFGGPPTPVEDTMHIPNTSNEDADVMMGYEQTSDGMSGLRVSCDDDEAMDQDMDVDAMRDQVRRDLGLDGISSQEQAKRISGRIAKLHMGFMAGCTRCAQKVPGHYSHIIWEGADGSRIVRDPSDTD